MKRPFLLSLALLLATSGLAADLVVFVNGDRLSGQIVATGTRRVRLKTPYGRLEIPRTEIERLVWEDGRDAKWARERVCEPLIERGLIDA